LRERRSPAPVALGVSYRGPLRVPPNGYTIENTRCDPADPKVRGTRIRREEFNRVVEMLNERGQILGQVGATVEQLRRDLDIQFQRIAQIQAELDHAWAKVSLL
jgi:hypothetical protein